MKKDLPHLLLWVEKEKVLDWFSPAGLSVLIQASNPELNSVAKILENFENPKILDEKFESFEDNLTFTHQKDERRRITDVAIYSMKDGGMNIRCRIDGRQMLSKPLKEEDARNLSDKTDRKALAEKYFTRELENNRE